MRYGKSSGHHRGLRAEHVFKGVARELERANCLLKCVKAYKVSGQIVNNEQTRDGLLAVLADNSTDEQLKFYLFGKVGKCDPSDPLQGRGDQV